MPEPLVDEGRAGLAQLAAKWGLTWDNLMRARSDAEAERRRLSERIGSARLVTGDTGFVVFGSLARGEWTAGSDVDWALLIDGPADDAHLTSTHEIRRILKDLGYKEPGREGFFGGLSVSHELVHRIGGNFDSNRNITQRILLLLESDSPLPNDLVRARLKLRLSRKLTFTAGLAACLSCKLRPPMRPGSPATETETDYASVMAEHLLSFTNSTPLDTLAWLALEFEAGADVVRDIMDSYDAYLEIVADESKRKRLENLGPEESNRDSLFAETRDIGDRFQKGLTGLFLDTNDDLRVVTQRYGVF